MKKQKITALAVLLTLITLPTSAIARIKLITLPEREHVEIRLDHPNTTLVEEERIVPVIKGINQIDFSWTNTRIDPETLVFRISAVEENDQVDAKVLSVSYPPGENALVWNVYAKTSGTTKVRISYVLGQLNKSFSYRAIADKEEQNLKLFQYIRIENFANEEFSGSNIWAGYGKHFIKPIGLNESRKILMEKYVNIPIIKTYTIDAAEHGYLDRVKNKLLVPMHYVLKNNKQNNLGKSALPHGKVRLFQQDGHGTNAFIGEDWGKFTPLDDEMRLYLGVAKDIVVKRTIEKSTQKRIAGKLFQHDIIIKYEIENFKDHPVTLSVAEDVRHVRNEVRGATDRDIEWTLGIRTSFSSLPDAEKSNSEKLVFNTSIPGRSENQKAQKTVHRLHLTLKNEW